MFIKLPFSPETVRAVRDRVDRAGKVVELVEQLVDVASSFKSDIAALERLLLRPRARRR